MAEAGIDLAEELEPADIEEFIGFKKTQNPDLNLEEKEPEDIIKDPKFFTWKSRQIVTEEWKRNVHQDFDPSVERLPGYDIELGARTVHVRGFVHGKDGTEMEISDEVRSHVRDSINHYLDEGEVYVEEGLGQMIQPNIFHENYNELDDLQTAKEEDTEQVEEFEDKYEEGAEEMKELVEEDPEMREFFEELKEALMDAPTMKALEDVRALREAFIETRAENLPLHLHSAYGEKLEPEDEAILTRRSKY